MQVYRERLEALFNASEMVSAKDLMEALCVQPGPNRAREIKYRAKQAGFTITNIGHKVYVKV